MIARIGKTYTFDAAHRLPDHDGKCARPHGHTYALTVELEGPIQTAKPGLSESGMVMDYGKLDALVKPMIKRLDHSDLNPLLEPLGCWPTTAENIAAWVLGELALVLDNVIAVTVKETAATFARVEWQEQPTVEVEQP